VDDTLRELEGSGQADAIYNKWYGAGTRTNLGKRSFKIDSDKIDG
jgi:polar amino acid transport system substrate-binding protein